MGFPIQSIVQSHVYEICIGYVRNASIVIICRAFFLFNWIKFVLSKFKDNKFKLNHLFNCSNTAVMLDWKSTILELVITTLVSSAKTISVEFPIKILGKSLKYIKNNTSPRTDHCRTP